MAHIFSKINKASLQNKQLTVFIVSDKIWAFKWKLEFWKISINHHEFDSFLILNDIADEIGRDINKCDILILHN